MHLPSPLEPQLTIAVLVPCFNEAQTIAQVVKDFRRALPSATLYVYDNNSQARDRANRGSLRAIVRAEPLQGKGQVVRTMFADIDADIYVMVDGDDTYDASAAPAMIDVLLRDRVDMIVGYRVYDDAAVYRPGHRFGNALLTATVARLFGSRFKDILSGYRVSRRFVKSFPVFARAFEIETEITVHALALQMPLCEVPMRYRAQWHGSTSKLRTNRDGIPDSSNDL